MLLHEKRYVEAEDDDVASHILAEVNARALEAVQAVLWRRFPSHAVLSGDEVLDIYAGETRTIHPASVHVLVPAHVEMVGDHLRDASARRRFRAVVVDARSHRG